MVWGSSLLARPLIERKTDTPAERLVKGKMLAMDEFTRNDMPFDENGEEHAENGSSRRNFLKAAVAGSAAAVAVGGVGAATLTLTGHHTGLKRYLALDGLVSGVTSDACTTNTSEKLHDQTTYNKNESLFFWFLVKNVPAGSYTFNISPAITSSSLVQFQTSSSNNVIVYEGVYSFACNPTYFADAGTNILNHGSSLPITVTASGGKDLLLEVHLQAANTTGTTQTVTLTGNLYKGTTTNLEATSTAAQITING